MDERRKISMNNTRPWLLRPFNSRLHVIGTALSSPLPRLLHVFYPLFGYRYTSLPCCEEAQKLHACTYIRILRVYRVQTNRIDCSIQTKSLADGTSPLEYHCLSYTWHNPFDPLEEPKLSWFQGVCQNAYSRLPAYLQEYATWMKSGWDYLKGNLLPPEFAVHCDGRLIGVTRNLWNALQHLHAQGRSELDAIWIDQICINQHQFINKFEKSSQVGNMHTIYEKSKGVVIWLGPEDPQNENLDTVLDIADELATFEKYAAIDEDKHDTYRFDVHKEYFARKYDFEAWLSVRNFLRRSYFKRMWVFQEVVTARHIVVFCGNREIPWLSIRNISQAFTAFGNNELGRRPRPGHGIGVVNIPHGMERWRDRFREDPERGLRPFFGGMITEGNRSVYVCGEGHDMLYAHFGVCRYKDIVVDYNKTVEEVYIEFWTHVMNKVKDINFLTAVEDNNGEAPKRKWKRTPDLRGIWKGKINLRFRPPLPTWVPDFQVPRNPSSLTQHYTMTNPDGGFDICKFHVSRGYQLPKTTFEIDGHNHLILKGFHFDTVRETSECASELISKHARCIPNFLNLIASVMYDDRVYCTAEERISAICHTLVVWSRSSASIEQDILEDLDNVRKLLSLWLLYNLSIPGALSKKSEAITAQRALLTRLSDDERMRGLLPTTQEVDAEAAEHGHFLRTRVENLRRGIDAPVFVDERVEGYVGRTAVSFGDFALRGLRMFRTKQGFVGKGPVNILRGDEIWIFPGAYVPFILRRGKQGEYALVGHCYIHGIMDGEIVDSLRKREPEVVNIV